VTQTAKDHSGLFARRKIVTNTHKHTRECNLATELASLKSNMPRGTLVMYWPSSIEDSQEYGHISDWHFESLTVCALIRPEKRGFSASDPPAQTMIVKLCKQHLARVISDLVELLADQPMGPLA
jgi:hypothetical protein